MTTTSQRFLLSGAIALVILVGENLGLHAWGTRTQRRHLLNALDHLPPQTDCLFLGNSLVEAGCDLAAFKAAWPTTNSLPTPVNLALGATSPVEHYLIFRQALRHPLPVKYLIYGFFDDQLNAPVSGSWSELVGNRAFSCYFPREAAACYAPGSWFKRWQLAILGGIPMLAERSSLWSKVELLRRFLEDIGMPKHKTNRYGRVEDFSALEAKDLASFNRRCDGILETQAGFSRPVREILRLARERDIRVFLVEMPMPSRHRNVFYSSPSWTRLRAYLRDLTGNAGAVYIPASDWVEDDGDFEDATHLNEQGARVFSAQLATALLNQAAHRQMFAH